jgi:hypothetical protein
MGDKLKTTARFATALLLAALAGCGNGSNGSPDMAMGGSDMVATSCAMNPTTSVELLNACTTAQTGDATKDAPYFPSLAPNGVLPPLP